MTSHRLRLSHPQLRCLDATNTDQLFSRIFDLVDSARISCISELNTLSVIASEQPPLPNPHHHGRHPDDSSRSCAHQGQRPSLQVCLSPVVRECRARCPVHCTTGDRRGRFESRVCSACHLYSLVLTFVLAADYVRDCEQTRSSYQGWRTLLLWCILFRGRARHRPRRPSEYCLRRHSTETHHRRRRCDLGSCR
jgi:hypothetical protein